MKKIIYTLLLFIISVFNLFATHNKGGEITYKYISGYTYEISVTTYCNTSQPPTADRESLMIFWGDGDSSIVWRTNGPDNTGGIPPTPPGNGIPDGEQIAGTNIKKNIYTAQHTYPGQEKYLISMTDANRSAGILNIPNSVSVPLYIESEIYVFDPSLYCVSNSIQFAAPPIFAASIASGDTLKYNVTAIDPDKDSLSFELVPCKTEKELDIPGYTYPSGVTINPVNGEIAWPFSLIGPFAIAVKVTKWRNGSVVGYVIRDSEIDVFVSSNTPYFSGTNLWNTDINGNYTYNLSVGNPINLAFSYSDPNMNSTSIKAYGDVFDLAQPGSLTSTDFSTYSNAQFSWTPQATAIRKAPYIITFRGTSSGANNYQSDLTLMIHVPGTDTFPCPSFPMLSSHKEPWTDGQIKIFSNPFSEETKILINDLFLKTGNVVLRIYNLLGQEVIRENIHYYELILKRGYIADGMYIYSLTKNDYIICSGKIIIK